jgi:hypothetical protein
MKPACLLISTWNSQLPTPMVSCTGEIAQEREGVYHIIIAMLESNDFTGTL